MQVGNFLLGIERTSRGNRLVCKAVSGAWSVMWREDSLMFAMMMNLIRQGAENENVRDYIHSLATVMFVVTTYPHDLVALSKKGKMPFFEGVTRLVSEQNKYEASLVEKPSEKEEEEALREVGEMQEVQDELEKLEENG